MPGLKNSHIALIPVLKVSAVAGGVALLFVGAVYAARTILIVFAGILFSVFLRGIARLLETGFSLPRQVSVTVSITGITAVLVLLAIFVFPSSAEHFSTLSEELESATQSLKSMITSSPLLKSAEGQNTSSLLSALPLSAVASTAGSALRTILWGGTALMVIYIIGVYIAAQGSQYHKMLLFPFSGQRSKQLQSLLSDLDETLWWWTLGRLVSMLTVGIATAIGLYFIGIPSAPALGVIAGLLTFLPNLGPILAVVPPALIAMQQSFNQVLYVVIFYLLLQLLESYLITPFIQREGTRVLPACSIAFQLVLGVLLGAIGVAMAVPLLACTRTVAIHLRAEKA